LARGEETRHNAFVTTFRREIAAQGSSLHRYFERLTRSSSLSGRHGFPRCR
jgi:hypothetical protein